MKHLIRRTINLTLIISLLLTICACGGQKKNIPAQPVDRSGFYFNTFINVKLYDTDDTTILDDCMAMADRFEKLFSATLEGSDIWNVNHAKGAPVTVDEETAALLQIALDYAGKTDGLFDPTIGAVSTMWNFTNEPLGPVPEKTAIEEALQHIDVSCVTLNGNTVQLTDPDARIDLGAIAKGYIADRLKDLLLERGVKSAIINLGGNVLTIGEKPDGTSFRIGVQKPFSTRNETIAAINVNDLSMVSSGNYERYFVVDDVLYHHILDPATGFPVDNGLLGVTILSEKSVDGDALSTTCFILGLEDGLKLIEETEKVEALFITGNREDPDSYELHYSSGFPVKPSSPSELSGVR